VNASDERPPIIGSTTITFFDQVKAFYWSAPRLWWLGAGCLLIFWLTQMASPADDDSDTGIFSDPVVILGGVCVLWLALIAFGYWRLSQEQKRVSYRVTADQIVTSDGAGAAVTIPWSGIKRCRETRSGFVLRLKPAGLRWLPKHAFSDDAVTVLRSLIADRLGAQAKLRK
jgi:hypothetical protein